MFHLHLWKLNHIAFPVIEENEATSWCSCCLRTHWFVYHSVCGSEKSTLLMENYFMNVCCWVFKVKLPQSFQFCLLLFFFSHSLSFNNIIIFSNQIFSSFSVIIVNVPPPITWNTWSYNTHWILSCPGWLFCSLIKDQLYNSHVFNKF